MRRSLKILVGIGLVLAASAFAGRYVALPYAERQLLAVLQGAGFNQAMLKRTSLGFYTLAYALRPAPGEEVMAVVEFNPLSSLLSGNLHLASASLVLGADWKIPGYVSATPDDTPVIKQLERKFFFPALNVQLDKLEVTTPLGALTAQLTYSAQQLSGTWQLAGYGGDIAVAAEAEGAYAFSLGNSTGDLPFTLNIKGGRAEPVIIATASAPLYPIGPVAASDIRLSLNSDGKSGYNVPFVIDAVVAGKPAQVKGTTDLLAQTAKLTATGDLKYANVDATGIKTTLTLSSVMPPVVSPGATFSAATLQIGGLPLIAPRATYGFRNNQLNLQSAGAGLFGGRVGLAPVRLTLPLQRARVTANFEELDLAQVLQLAKIEGLGGQGYLSGSIPVTYQNDKITLGDAQLKAAGAGQIHYAPAEKPAFLAEGGQAAMLGQVFSDFQYTGLTLSLGGTLGDNLTLGARLVGSNPTFYNGHSVAFNLNLSGALESLLRNGLQSFQFSPEAIKQMTEEGTRP